ncbi:MAG: chorismate synthase [Chitinophagales bacterium]|nr:chorismate synthase [Chitinophagales bacterium]MDW8418758.1 chorismate synthase [Chitinophagales bacterium]
MASNSFGEIFRITTFGESHGPGIGVVIDGCPAGLEFDRDFINRQMQKRRPGQSALTTARQEADEVEILSGVFEGKTTGAPIAMFIRNTDARSADYENLKTAYRPSHADYTYEVKYGLRDYRGGGRASARETAARVAAGAVAQLLLNKFNIQIFAYVSAVGAVKCPLPYTELPLREIYAHPVRCPHGETALQMQQLIEKMRDAGDTIGGIITGVIKGCPPGLGEPVYAKLHAELGRAMLSINAVHGFEYGSGFAGTIHPGSEHNDAFATGVGREVITRTNHSGGVQGGISNGMDIYFNVAFKPVATIKQTQQTINQQGEPVSITMSGRHDPCVLPRAVPVVEAMSAIVIADALLRHRLSRC